LKQGLIDALEADDVPAMSTLLEQVDGLKFTFEQATESKIGKEIGRCAKHSDKDVVARAQGLIGKIQKLARRSKGGSSYK